jgi:hypothetical protein
MPYFTVLVEGSGFKIPGTSGELPVVGFAVSRVDLQRILSLDLHRKLSHPFGV